MRTFSEHEVPSSVRHYFEEVVPEMDGKNTHPT